MRLRCPSCRDTFPWDKGKAWPSMCPLCRYDISLDPANETAVPYISFGKGKVQKQSADQTYRQYEAATEERAKEAASILNVPTAEMSDLKVTNMNTQLRQGDYAVKPVDNDVSRFMQTNSQIVQNMNNPQVAMGYAAAAHTGKDAYAGAKAASMLRGIHESRGMPTSSVPTKELIDQSMRTGKRTTF